MADPVIDTSDIQVDPAFEAADARRALATAPPVARAAIQQSIDYNDHKAQVDELMGLVKGGGAPAPKDHASDVDELVGLVSGPEANKDKFDRGVVPPVKDSVQDEADLYNKTMGQPTSWLRTATKAMMPKAMAPSVDSLYDNMNPRGARAAGRSVMTHAAGLPGDIEAGLTGADEAFRGGPQNPALQGHTTALPTSEEFNQGLARAGYPEDRTRKPFSDAVGNVASVALPMAVSGVSGASKAEQDLAAARGVADTARERGNTLVDAHPAPVAMPGATPLYPEPRPPVAQHPDVPPSYPEPRPPEAPAARPAPVPPVRRVAANDVNTVLEGHLAENEARLGAAKGQAWKDYQAGLQAEADDVAQAHAPNPGAEPVPSLTGAKPVDLTDTLDKWTTRAAKSEDTIAGAIGKVTNSLKSIQSRAADGTLSHAETVQALHDLKRQVGEAGKGVTDATGYAALKGNLAAQMERDINAAIKDASPAYSGFTSKYRELSQEAEPLDRGFLKNAGEPEGAVQMKQALATPKNVRSTIDALGPDGKSKFDTLAVQHVKNELGRKSAADVEEAYLQMKPSLRELPQARAEVEQLMRSKHLEEANTGLIKHLEEVEQSKFRTAMGAQKRGEAAAEESANAANASRKAQRDARFGGAMSEQKATHQKIEADTAAENKVRGQVNDRVQSAHEKAVLTARSYKPLLNNLQSPTMTPTRQVQTLGQLNKKLFDDGLISEAEHAGYAAQIERAAHGAEKAKDLATLSKYIIYSVTGNYMLSFGGPHAYEYITK